MARESLQTLTEAEKLKLELIGRFGIDFVDWIFDQAEGPTTGIQLATDHLRPGAVDILLVKNGGEIRLMHNCVGMEPHDIYLENTRQSSNERSWKAIWRRHDNVEYFEIAAIALKPVLAELEPSKTHVVLLNLIPDEEFTPANLLTLDGLKLPPEILEISVGDSSVACIDNRAIINLGESFVDTGLIVLPSSIPDYNH